MVATIVNSQWTTQATADFALTFTPTSGNLLLALVSMRDIWTTGSPLAIENGGHGGAAYTSLEDYGGDAGSNPGAGSGYWDNGTQAAIRTADGAETIVHVHLEPAISKVVLVVVEIADADGSPVTAIDSAIGPGDAATGPAVSMPGAGLVIGWFEQGSDLPHAARVLAAGSGWTKLYSETDEDPDDSKPHNIAVYKTSVSGSAQPLATSDQATPGWVAITIGFPGPMPFVLADWDGDGFGGWGTDDDLTGDTASWRITRGASPEITGGAQPGTATVVLNNPSDDRYNPLNAAGPLYGKLRDGVPFWIGVNPDGSVTGTAQRGLFGGRIKDITPIPSAGGGRALQVEITCEDALGWLDRTPATISDTLFRSQGGFRGLVLAAAGETRTVLPSEIITMPLSSWDGSALGALEAINRANGSRHFARPADVPDDWYDYVVRSRQWRLDGSVDASIDAGTDYLTGSDGWRLSADTVINQQRATVTPITFTSGQVAAWEAENLPFGINSTSGRVIWVEFDDYLNAPTVDYNYTGTAPTVVLEPFGRTARLTLTTSGITTITGLSIEGRLARRGVAESHVADDTTSQAGPRGIRAGADISGDFVGVLASATGIAEHVVWRYGNTQYRPGIVIQNWYPEMFEVDLFDILSVTIDQLGMTARHFEIVGLTLEGRIAASADVSHHVLTLVLQECRVQTDPYWFVLSPTADRYPGRLTPTGDDPGTGLPYHATILAY